MNGKEVFEWKSEDKYSHHFSTSIYEFQLLNLNKIYDEKVGMKTVSTFDYLIKNFLHIRRRKSKKNKSHNCEIENRSSEEETKQRQSKINRGLNDTRKRDQVYHLDP